jgi:hypothetical protein
LASLEWQEVVAVKPLADYHISDTSSSNMTLHPGYIIPVITAVTGFVRWLYKKARRQEITNAFVEDLANNHIPYMHRSLRAIADGLGIDIGDHPPIKYISLNGHKETDGQH